MRKQKILILLILSIFIIGMSLSSVSAATYKDYCHGGGQKHKTTWTKKYVGKSYVGTVYKNGQKYKKYVKLYELTCKCKKTKYHKEWLKHHGGKYYTYTTVTATNKPKYVYKKVKAKKSGNYVASKKSNKFHYASCASAKRIKSYNKITFSSRSKAINSGYKPCATCHP